MIINPYDNKNAVETLREIADKLEADPTFNPDQILMLLQDTSTGQGRETLYGIPPGQAIGALELFKLSIFERMNNSLNDGAGRTAVQ